MTIFNSSHQSIQATFREIPLPQEDIAVSVASRYGDPVWRFHAELKDHQSHQFDLNFSRITMLDGTALTSPENVDYLSCLKGFVFSLVTNPPPSRPKLSTILKYIGHGPLLLMQFMHKERIRQFSQITKDDFSRFLEWCASLPNQNNPQSPIKTTTLNTRSSGLIWLYDQRKKMADGIGFNPWAEFPPSEWAKRAAQNTERGGRTIEMPDEIAERLVNLSIAAIQSSMKYHEAEAAYKRFRATGQKLGFDWRVQGFQDHFDWYNYPSYITTAGYILIAMFSGMRVDEIVSMRISYTQPGSEVHLPCVFKSEVEIKEGVRECHFIRAYTKKFEKVPRLTQWQTAPIVQEAVEAITHIRAAKRGEEGFLFAARQKTSITRRMNENSINDALQKFVARHDIRWAGDLWPLATHQFRKKFARLLVRQGLGLRDIQDQLKHCDIEMTKRYGHMDLYDELQREKFILSKEQYEELLSGSTPIIGGGAARIEQLRREFIGKTRADRDAMLDTLARSALIDAVDFGYCMFNAGRSKCSGAGGHCKPADCLNSVIPLDTAVRHLRERVRKNDHLLRKVRSPTQRAHILSIQESTQKLLEQAAVHGVQTTADLKASKG